MKLLFRITGWMVSSITSLSEKLESWQSWLELKYDVYEDEVIDVVLPKDLTGGDLNDV